MVTHRPNFDRKDQYFQVLLQRLRSRVGDDTIDDMVSKAAQAYRDGHKRPYVRDLARDVLSGRWRLGEKQIDVATYFGINRKGISEAKVDGAMAMDVFAMLLAVPSRPRDWDPIDRDTTLIATMGRSGFISAVQYVAREIPSMNQRSRIVLSEFAYELLCQLLCHYDDWNVERQAAKGTQLAVDLFDQTLKAGVGSLLPKDFSQKEIQAIEAGLWRLRDQPNEAFQYLCQLQDDWELPFLFAFSCLDGIGR